MEDLQKGRALLEHKKGPAIEAYARIGTISGVARAIGVSRDAIHDWLRNDKAFERAFKDAKNILVDKAEEVLYEKAFKDKDISAISMVLRANRAEVYTERRIHEFAATQIPQLVSAFVMVVKKFVAPDRIPHVVAELQNYISTTRDASSQFAAQQSLPS